MQQVRLVRADEFDREDDLGHVDGLRRRVDVLPKAYACEADHAVAEFVRRRLAPAVQLPASARVQQEGNPGRTLDPVAVQTDTPAVALRVQGIAMGTCLRCLSEAHCWCRDILSPSCSARPSEHSLVDWRCRSLPLREGHTIRRHRLLRTDRRMNHTSHNFPHATLPGLHRR